MKVLVFFKLLSRNQRQQAGGNISPEPLLNLKEDQKGAGYTLNAIKKRSWTEIVFHHDAKKRLNQYKANLHKMRTLP